MAFPWVSKQGSKWKSMPSQMLRYRAAAFWQRVYCPEISMGLITKEEAEDIQDAEIISDAPKKRLEDIAAEAMGLPKEEVTEAPDVPEPGTGQLFE